MEEPVHSTLVTLDRGAASGLGVDRVVGDLDAAGMAALYRESDVLLKLSRSEGLGLPPLEAGAVGTPSVVTPYGGHADWLRHGVNGVQVGFDDLEGTAAWLDLLARDPSVLRALGDGALATARAWPSVEQSADAMAAALTEIAASGAAGLDDTRRASAHALARGLAMGRVTQAGHYDAIATLDRERSRMVAERRMIEDRLEAVLSSRAYRWAVRVRELSQLVRRPLSRAARRGPRR
jgi:hypothetical protein